MRRLCKAVLALSIVPGVLVLDDDLGFVAPAQAVVGRPLTPGSVAGVARRTGRRAYRRSAVPAVLMRIPAAVVIDPYPYRH
jgi:hypothetical protein